MPCRPVSAYDEQCNFSLNIFFKYTAVYIVILCYCISIDATDCMFLVVLHKSSFYAVLCACQDSCKQFVVSLYMKYDCSEGMLSW